jgi:hypothetical protein
MDRKPDLDRSSVPGENRGIPEHQDGRVVFGKSSRIKTWIDGAD